MAEFHFPGIVHAWLTDMVEEIWEIVVISNKLFPTRASQKACCGKNIHDPYTY